MKGCLPKQYSHIFCSILERRKFLPAMSMPLIGKDDFNFRVGWFQTENLKSTQSGLFQVFGIKN